MEWEGRRRHTTRRGVYLNDPDVTRRYTSISDYLRASALDPAESIRTLASIKDEMHEPEGS